MGRSFVGIAINRKDKALAKHPTALGYAVRTGSNPKREGGQEGLPWALDPARVAPSRS